MKTMRPPGYHHDGVVATHALGHMMYSLRSEHFVYRGSLMTTYVYIIYIYIYIFMVYIIYISLKFKGKLKTHFFQQNCRCLYEIFTVYMDEIFYKKIY